MIAKRTKASSFAGRNGDAAGEHRRMPRGRYSGWGHVYVAFVYQILGLYLAFLVPAVLAIELAVTDYRTIIQLHRWVMVGFVPIALILAILSFRDRWRCIEAFASRFVSGIAVLSMIYVPLVALVYANVRAFQRFRGR